MVYLVESFTILAESLVNLFQILVDFFERVLGGGLKFRQRHLSRRRICTAD